MDDEAGAPAPVVGWYLIGMLVVLTLCAGFGMKSCDDRDLPDRHRADRERVASALIRGCTVSGSRPVPAIASAEPVTPPTGAAGVPPAESRSGLVTVAVVVDLAAAPTPVPHIDATRHIVAANSAYLLGRDRVNRSKPIGVPDAGGRVEPVVALQVRGGLEESVNVEVTATAVVRSPGTSSDTVVTTTARASCGTVTLHMRDGQIIAASATQPPTGRPWSVTIVSRPPRPAFG
ncbi:hypothetical protein [Actinoplanes sp. NPDC049681]|uniref:hypothetical protein n=1 Tax=Actinoplanes sp. NPDC049681 TaxID=3363905 RepID=UPI0037B4B15F